MSPDDFKRLMEDAATVDILRNDNLLVPARPITHCWFPLSGMVSLIALDADGNEAEVGIAGNDGMVDVATILGDNRVMMRVLVQISGTAVRVDARRLQDALRDSPALLKLLLAYARAFSLQVSSSALAFAQYSIEQRLARWVLMCADRVGETKIALTHEALSIMLGVRRAGVTQAMQSLEGKGMIANVRGVVSITSRSELLAAAGGGYGMPEAEYERLLGYAPQLLAARAS